MYFYRRKVPGIASFSYLIGDEKTRQCVVVDPVRDVDDYLLAARKESMTITHILETHVHADFVSGARELKARLDGLPTIHCSGMGGKEWIPSYADHIVHDRNEISLGALRLQARYTPGHTPEHIVWLVYDEARTPDEPCLMLSGDFLFVGDIGRPDLLGPHESKKLTHQLYESVFTFLEQLPDFMEVYPSHGAGSLCGKAIGSRDSTTIGFEKRFNPSLLRLTESEWVDKLLDRMPPAPPYFKRMKKMNVEGPPILGDKVRQIKPFSAQAATDFTFEKGLILDVRSKEAFSSLHIPGSINIPLSPTLSSWAGWVLPYDRPLLLVLDSLEQLPETAIQLFRVGFDRIDGYLEGGINSWESAGLKSSHIDVISVQELEKSIKSETNPLIIDVRTQGEWEAGHIQGARHIPVGNICERVAEIPKGTPLTVICGSGYRASIAASLLKREGFHSISNVLGGMAAWSNEHFPQISG